MTLPNHRVRRATLDDLPGLRALWRAMHFPEDELEKRLTEFQVVQSAEGRIAGSIGVQILGAHGCLHSEAYQDFGVADDLRPMLMERIQSLASNHGVLRLWTREKSPFWTRSGFRPATPDALKKLPEAWSRLGADWLTFQLKDEAAIVSMEKELALFMDSEKQQTQRALNQVRVLKIVATLLAGIFAIFIIGAILYLFRKNPEVLLPGKR